MTDPQKIFIKKLWNYWAIFIVSQLIIVGGILIRDHFELQKKADREFVSNYYTELYKLISEQNATMAQYIKSNDREKDQLWTRIQGINNQVLDHLPKDIKRGEDVDLESILKNK